MNLPLLSNEDVESIIKGCRVVGAPCKGGQKIVFPCVIDGKKLALKFILVTPIIMEGGIQEITTDILDEATARASREVDIMRKCNSPYLIKLGHVNLQRIVHKEQMLILFSEEWIEGEDLNKRLQRSKILEIDDVIKLGIHITKAIEVIWGQSQVHRDIKPGNIIHSTEDDRYILLDLGLALDINDRSLTAFGAIPCTKSYVSPEQLNIQKKRQMDFRSDLFNLGIVMYECLTGIHPFYKAGMTDMDIFAHVLTYNPPLASSINSRVPKELDAIVVRLLGKSPHLRYRNCSQLIESLEKVGM